MNNIYNHNDNGNNDNHNDNDDNNKDNANNNDNTDNHNNDNSNHRRPENASRTSAAPWRSCWNTTRAGGDGSRRPPAAWW